MSHPHSSIPALAAGAAPTVPDLVRLVAAGTLAGMRRLRDSWRHGREVRDTHLALEQLDERTLRDLGIRRSELWSLAAETHGDLRTTRALAAQSVRGIFS